MGQNISLMVVFVTPVSLRVLVFKHINKVDHLVHRLLPNITGGRCTPFVWKYALLSFRILIVRKPPVRSNGRT